VLEIIQYTLRPAHFKVQINRNFVTLSYEQLFELYQNYQYSPETSTLKLSFVSLFLTNEAFSFSLTHPRKRFEIHKFNKKSLVSFNIHVADFLSDNIYDLVSL
jgi:hypothetical protein